MSGSDVRRITSTTVESHVPGAFGFGDTLMVYLSRGFGNDGISKSIPTTVSRMMKPLLWYFLAQLCPPELNCSRSDILHVASETERYVPRCVSFSRTLCWPNI